MAFGLILILLLPTLAQSVMADPSQARIQDVANNLVGATTTPLAGNAQAPTHRITLITGDVVVVTLFPDGRKSFAVDPVDPREEFKSFTQGNDTYIVPSSARLDKLDMNLFDVDYLLREKYHELPYLPLLVTGTSKTAIQTLIASQSLMSSITHTFRILPAFAVKPRLSDLRSVYENLAGKSETAKIWLDRVNHVNLNESVPLIGAPSVWTAGYNGSGINIAILDTGIDPTHPDVSGKIVTAIDLTDDGTTDDLFGHGTHVAVIAAGTGIASEGKFKGVALGASLMNIKVLNRYGYGYDSWIISGIEYAANNGANIISMSLGGSPTDGNDPMSQAVDAAVAKGVVAAIAAGNSGSYSTVGAPGAARKAITVGASDKSDNLAWFSSRGPTVDFRVKPDVLAPGVNIISGHATNCIPSSVCSYIPNPPGEPSSGPPNYPPYYWSLSGTSMATPHVSGLIALIKQANPTWTPAFIKDALINTALQLDGYDIYEQGGGRIQALDAVQTAMLMDPGSYSFGVLSAPPVGAVYSDFAVYNLGGSAFDVSLSITLVDIQSGSSYSSAVTMNVTSLSVPSSSSKGIRLTIDLMSLPTSVYSGLIYATRTDGKTIHSVFGFAKLRPVSVMKLNRQGNPAKGDWSFAFKTSASSQDDYLFNWRALFTDANGAIAFFVADGTYTLTSFDSDERGMTIADNVDIHDRTELVLDERNNMHIAFDPAAPNQKIAGTTYKLEFEPPYGNPGFAGLTDYPSSFDMYIGMTSGHVMFGYKYYPESAYNASDPFFVNAPTWVDLLYYSHGISYPLSFTADYSQIVHKTSTYAVKVSPNKKALIGFSKYSKAFNDGFDFETLFWMTLPQRRTELLSPDIYYSQTLEVEPRGSGNLNFISPFPYSPYIGWPIPEARESYPGRSWPAGQSFEETWNGILSSELNLYADSADSAQVFGSVFIDGYLHHFQDATRPIAGYITATKDGTTLFSDTLSDLYSLSVPISGFGTYDFNIQGTQTQPLSTRTTANFTVNIGSAGLLLPPLIEFRSSQIDLYNTATGSPVHMHVRVETPSSLVTDVSLKYSINDEASWITVPTSGTGDPKEFVADLPLSASGYASLWATASDGNGNTVSQIVKRAFAYVAPKPTRISSNAYNSLDPSVAVSGSYVYLSWSDSTPVSGSGTAPEIWLRISSNSGISFGSPIRLTMNTGASEFPSVAAVGSYVYVAWQDDTPVTGSGYPAPEIWMRVSTNSGASFGPAIRITTNTGYSLHPSVAASGSHVYVAWYDDTPVTGSGGSPEIWLRASSNNGATFGSAIRISANIYVSVSPSVAASGSFVYVAWEDYTPVSGSGGAIPEIWMRTSSNNGATFGSAIRITTNTGLSELPSVAAVGNYVYIAWEDSTPVTGSGSSYEVWFRASSNSGASFGSPVRISTNMGSSDHPSVTADGSNVYVAWADNTPVSGSGGDFEVWLRASSNNGAAFGSAIRISTNTGSSIHPSATYVSYVYVAWEDSTPVSGSGSAFEIWLRVGS
jgi:subtilisin family serine protease